MSRMVQGLTFVMVAQLAVLGACREDGFKPTPFGLIRSRMEKYPLRWTTDAALVPTENAPETWVTDPNSSEYNRKLPNPLYAKISNAPFEVPFFMGASGGIRRINVGAPPEMFAGGTGDPAKIAGMEWNGRVYATKNFPIQCVDANGATQENSALKRTRANWHQKTPVLDWVGQGRASARQTGHPPAVRKRLTATARHTRRDQPQRGARE